MHNTPTPDELLDVVARYLTEVAMPLLPPAAAFHARVAANALNVVRRQIALEPRQSQAERERLEALGLRGAPAADTTGADEGAQDLARRNRELAEAIAQGRIDPADPALLAHLWQTTMERLSVDQPQYASYQAEVRRG